MEFYHSSRKGRHWPERILADHGVIWHLKWGFSLNWLSMILAQNRISKDRERSPRSLQWSQELPGDDSVWLRVLPTPQTTPRGVWVYIPITLDVQSGHSPLLLCQPSCTWNCPTETFMSHIHHFTFSCCYNFKSLKVSSNSRYFI